jgi:hypothetical protein
MEDGTRLEYLAGMRILHRSLILAAFVLLAVANRQ